jgi:hypothetical protein
MAFEVLIEHESGTYESHLWATPPSQVQQQDSTKMQPQVMSSDTAAQ